MHKIQYEIETDTIIYQNESYDQSRLHDCLTNINKD